MDEYNTLIRIATAIYCRSICLEFRRPVECLYPHIINEYLSVVSKPMDLGTILLNCHRKIMTFETFKEDLKLVFENAIKFNSETPQMEAISTHLDAFAGGLYEEAFKIPYRGDIGLTIEDRFSAMMLSRRRCRMEMTKNMILSIQECQMIISSLEELLLFQFKLFKQKSEENNEIGIFVVEIIRRCRSSIDFIQSALAAGGQGQGNDGNSNSEESGHSKDELVSIISLFRNLMTACSTPIETNSETIDIRQPSLLRLLHPSKLTNTTTTLPSQLISLDFTVKPKYLPSIIALDECIGEPLVYLAERGRRGCPLSCLWAHPIGIVWAQPLKHHNYKSPWWNVMILAGGKGTGVPSLINDVNLQKLPTYISKALTKRPSKSKQQKALTVDDEDTTLTTHVPKPVHEPGSSEAIDDYLGGMESGCQIPLPDMLKSRVRDSSTGVSTMLVPPDGQYLVEFFGTHDFYWVKKEQTSRFPIDGSLTTPGSRVSSETAIKEGISASRWLERMTLTTEDEGGSEGMEGGIGTGEVSNDLDVIDIQPPTVVELEMSLLAQPRKATPAKRKSADSSNSGIASSATATGRYKSLSDATSSKHIAVQHVTGETSNTKLPAVAIVESGKFMPNRLKLSRSASSSNRSRAIARTKVLTKLMSWVKPILPIDNNTSIPSSNLFAYCPDDDTFNYQPPDQVQQGTDGLEGQCSMTAEQDQLLGFGLGFEEDWDGDEDYDAIAGIYGVNKVRSAGARQRLVKSSMQQLQANLLISADIVSQANINTKANNAKTNANTNANAKALDFSSLSCLDSSKRSTTCSTGNIDTVGTEHMANKKLRTSSPITGTVGAMDAPVSSSQVSSLPPAVNLSLIPSQITCVVAGEGLLHTKRVDLSAEVFFREHPSCEVRKRILRKELSNLNAFIGKMQAAASVRAGGGYGTGAGGAVSKNVLSVSPPPVPRLTLTLGSSGNKISSTSASQFLPQAAVAYNNNINTITSSSNTGAQQASSFAGVGVVPPVSIMPTGVHIHTTRSAAGDKQQGKTRPLPGKVGLIAQLERKQILGKRPNAYANNNSNADYDLQS